MRVGSGQNTPCPGAVVDAPRFLGASDALRMVRRDRGGIVSRVTNEDLADAGPGPDGRRPASSTPSAASPTRSRCAGRTATPGGELDLGRLRRAGDPARRAPPGPRGRPGRPGRADDAQPARVPRRRHGRAARSAPRPISIYNSSAPEQVAVPGRALRGVGRDRRGRELPRAASQGPRRAARRSRTSSSIDDRRRRARRRARRGTTLLAARPARSRRRPPRSRSPTTSRRHLHVGHDRSAEGRDARPRRTSAGRSRACALALGDVATAGRRARLVPADGAHRRADDVALPGRRVRLRGHDLSRGGTDRAVPARGAAARSSSRCRGSGRRCTPGSWRSRAADPDRKAAARRRARRRRCRSPSYRAPRRGAAGRPRRRAGRASTREALALGPRRCSGSTSASPRSAARRRSPVEVLRLLPRARRADLGDLRDERVVRADDLGAVPGQGRHRRPRDPGHARCGSPRTAR